LIALIRKHAEGMKPPRALAVPFELGRPLGVPNDPAFQHRVLADTLALLERTDGPILEDFPDAAPAASAEETEGWACPVNLAPPPPELSDHEKVAVALTNEIALLRPWYEESTRNAKGRTMVGLSGMAVEDIPGFILGFMADNDIDSPVEGEPLYRAIKLSTEDLRHFYYEAALARPGNVRDTDLADWFWGETLAGKVYLKLRDTVKAIDNERMQWLAGTGLVPGHQAARTA
jgi:hypothetical protein